MRVRVCVRGEGGGVEGPLYPILFVQNLTLNSNPTPQTYSHRGLPSKHHSEKHVISDAVIKQSKWLNGAVEPDTRKPQTGP